MANIYTYQMTHTEEDGDDFITSIQVGDYIVQFRFLWPTASYEQYSNIERHYNKMTKNDPLIADDIINTDYNYIVYYLKARDEIKNIVSPNPYRDWLDSQEYLPRSISVAPSMSQELMLQERIAECSTVEPIIAQYIEVLRWQFRMSFEDEVNVGTITPGGWYRNQNTMFSFRFVTELESVGRDDINNVTIQFEVYQ